MIVELEIKDLVIPQGLLPRVLTGTVEEKVQEYAEMLEEGVEFDPILVWEKEDGYWVVDGVHRIEAHKRAGRQTIKAKLIKCENELDYRIKAIQANLKHGLALAKGEKPLLAQMLYEQGLSEEEIRKIFGVSERTLFYWLAPVKERERQEKIRKAIELREKGWKIEDIAKELGVNDRTVRSYISEYSREAEKTAKIAIFSASKDPTSQSPSVSPPFSSQLAGSQPAFSEDWEQVISRITPDQTREAQEALEEEVRRKPGPGRPKKEPLPLDRRQLDYWRDRILEILYDIARGWGWEDAENVLRQVIDEFYETKESSVR